MIRPSRPLCNALLKILLFIILAATGWAALRYFTQQTPRVATSKPMSSTMDRAQACAVLGVEDTELDKAAVIAAHRRLMQHVHPDKGGSALLAQQLNEAKRLLLSLLTK